MSKVLRFAFFFLIVLAGCQVPPGPQPSQYDWCYIFEFTTNSYGVNFIDGSWVSGAGLKTNGSGRLSVSYVNTLTVEPIGVVIDAALATSAVTNITAAGIIFGMTPPTESGQVELASDGASEQYQIPLYSQNAGDSGNSFNITLQASQELSVTRMTVYGTGATPFGVNSCEEDGSTFTPIPTLQPTGTPPTPTPTSTATPTTTLTPSPTSTPDDACTAPWSQTWSDGLGNLQPDWHARVNAGLALGSYSSGWNYATQGGVAYLQLTIPYAYYSSTLLTNVAIQYTANRSNANSVGWRFTYGDDDDFVGLDPGHLSIDKQLATGSGLTDSFSSVNWSSNASYPYFVFLGSGNWSSGTGTLRLESISLSGTGRDPFTGACNAPTPTPAPTSTPTVTNTPGASNTPNPNATATLPAPVLATVTPSWCYAFDFRAGGMYGWTLDNGFRDTGGLSSGTFGFDNLTVTSPDAGSATYSRVELTFNTAFTGRARQILIGSDNTLSTLYTIRHSGFANPITLNIPYPSVDLFTLDIDRDRFNAPSEQFFDGLRLQVIKTYGRGANPFGADNCSPAPTATRGILTTPLPSGTPIATGTALPTYTLVATQTFVPTSVSTATMTATRDNLGIVDPAFVPWGSDPSDVGVDIGGSASDLLSTGQNAITSGENLILQGRGYLNTLTAAVTVLGSGWNDAVPTEIPGLPKCSTQRFASELCAIYYILTFTVFSGTIGSLIIPAATFAVFFWIFLAFVKLVVNILETLAKLQRVS